MRTAFCTEWIRTLYFAACISLGLIRCSTVYAQQLPIKSYTTADGLAHDRVTRIVRDSRGFLWFCTVDGLSRFDGTQFTTYHREQGLPRSFVNDILEARTGQYWVATSGGAARLNLRTGTSTAAGDRARSRFTTYPVGDKPATNRVRVLHRDRAGRLWTGTDGGLFLLEESRGDVSFRRVSLGLASHADEVVQVGALQAVICSGIDLQLHRGELVCLLGPNGAGKSTFLRTMAAMQRPLGGQVFLEGQDIHRINPRDLARRLSVVLTERVSAGMLSVYALVSLGRHPYTDWAGRLTERDHKVIQEAIETVGAVDLAHRPVGELSDGERQKVMVARALAQEPRLMILDEITAFLDLPRRVDIMRVMRRLAHIHSCTILLSTHDLELALRCADRVWLMPKNANGGATRMLAGAPEDLVLNGSFKAAFASEGIEFDRQAGHFRLHEITVGTAAVTGEGMESAWTVRALERRGYQIVAGGPADIAVEVMKGIDGVSWVASAGGVLSRHRSIGELVNSLAAIPRDSQGRSAGHGTATSGLGSVG